MPSQTPPRATISVDPALYEALQRRAEEADQSVADAVDEAVRALLAEDVEDAEDIAALDARRDEPSISFDVLVQDLSERGLI